MARGLRFPLALFLLVCAGCAAADPLDRAFGPDGTTLREAIQGFPEPQREQFELFRKRCSKCHSLDLPFSAHLPRGAWRAQVRLMARKSGAGIPPAEEEPIAEFLEYFFQERARASR